MNCFPPLWAKNVEKTMRLCHWAIMTWSKGKQLRTEVSHHDASTVRTIHSVEPFFRTFHHIAEQSFPFPLETPFSWWGNFNELPRKGANREFLLTFFLTLFLTPPG